MSQQEVAAAAWDVPPRSHPDWVSVDLCVVKGWTFVQGRYGTAGFLPHLVHSLLHVSSVSGTY